MHSHDQFHQTYNDLASVLKITDLKDKKNRSSSTTALASHQSSEGDVSRATLKQGMQRFCHPFFHKLFDYYSKQKNMK